MLKFYVSTIILILLFSLLVFQNVQFRKLPNEKIFLENRTHPIQTNLKPNDINVPAPSVVCSQKAADKKLYGDILPETKFNTNLLIPYKKQYTYRNIDVYLTLTNDGFLEYFANNERVWTSKNPHEYMKNVTVKLLLSEFVESCICLSEHVQLHLFPLRIMYKDQILWGFWGGFDVAHTCKNLSYECPIPVDDNTNGTLFLFSDDRIFRASLHENGDILIMKAHADTNNMFKWVKEIHSSFIENYCSTE